MAQRRLNSDYADRDKWLKMAVTNTAMSGIFSSDRTIREYNDTIWHMEPVSRTAAKKSEPAAKAVRMKSGK